MQGHELHDEGWSEQHDESQGELHDEGQGEQREEVWSELHDEGQGELHELDHVQHELEHVQHGRNVSGHALQHCELHELERDELDGEVEREELQGRGHDSLQGVALREEEPLHAELRDEGVPHELQGGAQLVQGGDQ